MKIKSNKDGKPIDRDLMAAKSNANKRLGPIAEDTYDAVVESISGKPIDTTPKKLIGLFLIESQDVKLTKKWPPSVDEGTPFRKDAEAILARKLTSVEIEAGFEIRQLVGKPCRVEIIHKTLTSGKVKAMVNVISTAKKAEVAA